MIVVFTLPGLFALFLSMVSAVALAYVLPNAPKYEFVPHFFGLAMFSLSGAELSRRRIPTSLFFLPNWALGVSLLFLLGTLRLIRGILLDWHVLYHWSTIGSIIFLSATLIRRCSKNAASLGFDFGGGDEVDWRGEPIRKKEG